MESNVKNLLDDVNMMLGLMELVSKFKDTIKERYDVDILQVDPLERRVHIYAGIDYLAWALGADTKTEPFSVREFKEKKYFEYAGYTFFQLCDTKDGEIVYR